LPVSDRSSAVPCTNHDGGFIRVLVADDHALVRRGLVMILHCEPDMLVVGDAPNGEVALALALELRPDVLLADVGMPAPGGIELARLLAASMPGVKVLLVSMYSDRLIAREGLEAGAAGYVTKMAAGDDLMFAIREVAAGRHYVDPTINL
jgi:two-component system, NarL family, invasion response regulator UvrY